MYSSIYIHIYYMYICIYVLCVCGTYPRTRRYDPKNRPATDDWLSHYLFIYIYYIYMYLFISISTYIFKYM